MVVQKAIDHLRERPKEDRTAVAIGIATSVAGLLFLAWIIFFFNKVHTITNAAPATPQSQDVNVAAAQKTQ